MTKELHGKAYKQWRDETADGFVQAQRKAFLAGFEAAADESETLSLLREWAEQERDKAAAEYKDKDDSSFLFYKQAYTDILVKLHEMGNIPESAKDD